MQVTEQQDVVRIQRQLEQEREGNGHATRNLSHVDVSRRLRTHFYRSAQHNRRTEARHTVNATERLSDRNFAVLRPP